MSRLKQTQYRSLRLSVAVRYLGELLAQQIAEHELSERTRSRIVRHLKQAQLPTHKPLEAFDYRHQTTITKPQVTALLDFGFTKWRQNLVFIGPPGVASGTSDHNPSAPLTDSRSEW